MSRSAIQYQSNALPVYLKFLRMLQSAVVTILLLLLATSNGLYRLPLKGYHVSAPSFARQNGRKIPLRDIQGISGVADIQVGNKQGAFYVQLDTGSSELILPSVNCESCGNHTTYKCDKESDFTVDVAYVLGEGSGRICMDSITIGGLTVQNQHIVVMEEEDAILGGSEVDGFLGLGFSSYLLGRQNISDYPYVPMLTLYRPTPVFINIVKQELVSLNVFSFYYSREETEGNEVIFGGFDHSRYTGNLSYANVIPEQSAWKVPLEGFKFGPFNVGPCGPEASSQCSAEIDTSKRDIWVPYQQGMALMDIIYSSAPSLKYKFFQSTKSKGINFWVESQDVPNLQPINIYIAGEKFTLEPSAYLLKADDDMYFLKLVVSNLDYWILGETFLSSIYTVFDVENMRIGFAPAV
jgi:hypothetical protein